VKIVKEASQRRFASHAHIHVPDSHGDQPRRLIIQPELTSKKSKVKTFIENGNLFNIFIEDGKLLRNISFGTRNSTVTFIHFN
jgi:hypothetical protein